MNMLEDAQLTERFEAVWQACTSAALRAGRAPCEVQLVAVSKNHGAEPVATLARHWAACHGAGCAGGSPLVFGESYMQEALEKQEAVAALLQGGTAALPQGGIAAPAVTHPQWHFIGHIQSRKAKELPGHFALVHSVDSVKVASGLQRGWEARVAGKPQPLQAPAPLPQGILLQVNIGREPQKSGVAPEEAEALCLAVMAFAGLRVEGLMCLPPASAEGEGARPYFRALAALREQLRQNIGLALPHLSMGMSGDFAVAIEEGATLVRVGSSIFGKR